MRVESAKATDTRAARWLLALVALSTAGIMLVPALVPTSFDQTYVSYLRVAALGLSILLPVVAILVFTGEWSQRSVMITFTQEPRRIRVLNAKLAVSLVLGGGGAVFGGVVTAAGLGLAAASGRALEANLSVGAITSYLLYVLLNVLAAVALGALLQNSAAAISASFALPAAFALLGTASTLVSEWIDMSTPWNWVLENDWGGHMPQISVSVLFWVVRTPFLAHPTSSRSSKPLFRSRTPTGRPGGGGSLPHWQMGASQDHYSGACISRGQAPV